MAQVFLTEEGKEAKLQVRDPQGAQAMGWGWREAQGVAGGGGAVAGQLGLRMCQVLELYECGILSFP